MILISKRQDIHYTVVETKAADGYILDETAHDVTLRYDDNAPDVVVTTLKLINVPTEPKLPQTGDNANPLLYLGIGALALITGVGVGLRGRKKKNQILQKTTKNDTQGTGREKWF